MCYSYNRGVEESNIMALYLTRSVNFPCQLCEGVVYTVVRVWLECWGVVRGRCIVYPLA